MKSIHVYFARMLAGSFLLGALSCKKSIQTQSNSCKLVAILDTGTYNGAPSTAVELFSYDSAGRLSKYQSINSAVTKTITYTYKGNLMIGTPDNPGYEPTDSVYLNDKGLPYRLIIDVPGQIHDNRTYTYDASGQLQSEIFVENNGVFNAFSIDFEYSGGDLVKETSNGYITNYTYYTDKPAADGDCNRVSQLIAFGIVIDRSAHLIKSTQSDMNKSNYTYTFDQSGKIISCTRVTNSSPPEKKVYEYDCSH